jgi:hypothetical protein
MPIHTVGIDIAKSVFHLVALDETGSITVKKKFFHEKAPEVKPFSRPRARLTVCLQAQ